MTRNFKDDLIERRPDVAEYLQENELRVSVAENLRAARRRAGLTQAQLSEKSGMTQPVISGMESPTGPMPTIPNMDKYMKACGEQMVLGFPAEKVGAVTVKRKTPVKGGEPTSSTLASSRTAPALAAKKAKAVAGKTALLKRRSTRDRFKGQSVEEVASAAAVRRDEDDHDHHAAEGARPYQHGIVVGTSLMIEEDPGNGALPENGAGTSD